MENIISSLSFLLLTLLLFGVAFIPILLLSAADVRRKQDQIAFLALYLQKAGFQKVPLWRSFLDRTNDLYATPSGRYSVSLTAEPYGEKGDLLVFVRFSIFLPQPGKFLICSPSLTAYTGQILYEIFWKTVRLDLLNPLGLTVHCEAGTAERLRQKLSQPAISSIFEPLVQSRQTFYILSESDDLLSILFAIRPPQTQRAALWLNFVQHFCQAIGDPHPPAARTQKLGCKASWLIIITVILILIALVSFLFFFSQPS